MTYNTLLLEKKDSNTLVLKFNRPELSNAINYEMLLELQDFWSKIIDSQVQYKYLIITGSGDKAFCGGADLKERNNLTTKQWKRIHTLLSQVIFSIFECPIPVIAAINGLAFGGGLEIALACDFAYSSDHALFSQPEVKRGIIPGAMGTQLLPRYVGISRAKELCYTGKIFDVFQAYEWGIINKICKGDSLMSEVLSCVEMIAENSFCAIRQVKKALNISLDVGVKSGYLYEIEAYNQLIGSFDRIEGIRAFNEKRKPYFKNK